MEVTDALECLLRKECDTITAYGQARHPLTGREHGWTVTLVTNQAKQAHLKRVGQGDTLTEALCAALADEGTTVANHAKRRNHRTHLSFEGVPEKYEDQSFQRMRIRP